MPLRCIDGEREELAFEHDDASWERLRLRNRSEVSLRLPCCGSPVVLKTSKLGTRFFAHRERVTCSSGPESPEHILAKSIIAQAAMRCGWSARTEDRYTDPEGDCIVDVCCWKPGASRGIAFEIQWSRQPVEETVRRTRRYASHGLRTLWLMRQNLIPVSKETPAVRIERTVEGFDVCLPRNGHGIRAMSIPARVAKCSPSQHVPLGRFVEGVLQGRLQFGLTEGGRVPIQAVGTETPCWRCKRPISVVTEIILKTDTLPSGWENLTFTLLEFGGLEEVFRTKVIDAIRPGIDALKIGSIKPRYSNAAGSSYLSNGCTRCGAISGDHYLHDVWQDARPLFLTAADFTLKELKACGATAFDRWWFDECD